MGDGRDFIDGGRQKAKLEDWYVGSDNLLHGNVYGHPKIPDGEFITTSRIVTLNSENGEAETLNTNYKLGSPKRFIFAYAHDRLVKERDDLLLDQKALKSKLAEKDTELDQLKAEFERYKQMDWDSIQRECAEVNRLKRIIAKELSENDELGNEYTYVMCLKEEVDRLTNIIGKDRWDDWKRIQDAEREVERLKDELEREISRREELQDARSVFGMGEG